ncbi:MAG TPA: protein kinase [Bacteroidales bacterium]|nr:protein kinase [Bacteroidales bacterium]
MTYNEFFDRYAYNVRTDKVGGGSFGTVYKAYDNILHRQVAIKVSEVKVINDKEFSLKDEFDAICNLPKHANIANYEELFTFATPQGVFDYAVMQFYPDGNLSSAIKAGMSMKQKEELAIELLKGIKHLHDNKVVHRDLKPGNILIVKHSEKIIPLITDFGLSKKVWEDAQSRHSMSFGGGTLKYSSPEQLKGESIRFNTDLWSYGAIVYELFTGKALFGAFENSSSAAAENKILEQILSDELSQNFSELPKKWEDVLKLCLDRNPETRVKKAELLLQVIENGGIQKKEPVISRSPEQDDTTQVAGKQQFIPIKEDNTKVDIVENNTQKHSDSPKNSKSTTISYSNEKSKFWKTVLVFGVFSAMIPLFIFLYNWISFNTTGNFIITHFTDDNAGYALLYAILSGVFVALPFVILLRKNNGIKWALAVFIAHILYGLINLFILIVPSYGYGGYIEGIVISFLYFLLVCSIPVFTGVIMSFKNKDRSFWKYIVIPWLIAALFGGIVIFLKQVIGLDGFYDNSFELAYSLFIGFFLGILMNNYIEKNKIAPKIRYKTASIQGFLVTYFSSFILGIAGVVLFLYVDYQSNWIAYSSFNDEYIFLLILCYIMILISFFTFLISQFLQYKILYNAWETIHQQSSETSPKKAVGLLFVPFYNLYWKFVAYYSFFKKINQIFGTQRANSKFALACCIISVIPYVNLLSLVLMPILITKIHNNTIFMLEQKGKTQETEM